MKKLIQFSLATIFAITLAACDNANQNSNSQNTAKTETILSAEEQFRKDYEAFTKWQNQAQQIFNTETAKLQQAAAQHAKTPNLEEGKKAISNFRDIVTEENKKLDALNLKDADVKNVADKMKEIHSTAIDVFNFIIEAANNPKDAGNNMQLAQEKVQLLQKLEIEVRETSRKLAEQYKK